VGLLFAFFLLTFAVTWACFYATLTMSHGSDITLSMRLVLLVGTFAPSFVAAALSALQGAPELKRLLSRVFQWQVPGRWYLFALGYMAILKIVVAFAARLLAGSWPHVGWTPVAMILAGIVISTPFQAGEEIGWRGFALPRLANYIGFSGASVVVGGIWALWHLPLFFLAGTDTYGQAFPAWALGVTAVSVAFAWLYTHTEGSLFITMLMHSVANNLPHFDPMPASNTAGVFSLHAGTVLWLTTAVLWIPAVYFLIRMPASEVPLRRANVASGFASH
jgi:hypothetical protein